MRVPMVAQRRVVYRAGSEFDTYWREFEDGTWSCCLFVGAHSVAYCHSAVSQSAAYAVCVELLGVSERENMYEPRVCAEASNVRNSGVTRPGVWYAVTDSGQWVDMAGVQLICVPALSVSDHATFDLAAARPASGSELAAFAREHGVSFYDILSIDY